MQTFEGPFRLSQALRLVFGLAVSVREDGMTTSFFRGEGEVGKDNIQESWVYDGF